MLTALLLKEGPAGRLTLKQKETGVKLLIGAGFVAGGSDPCDRRGTEEFHNRERGIGGGRVGSAVGQIAGEVAAEGIGRYSKAQASGTQASGTQGQIEGKEALACSGNLGGRIGKTNDANRQAKGRRPSAGLRVRAGGSIADGRLKVSQRRRWEEKWSGRRTGFAEFGVFRPLRLRFPDQETGRSDADLSEELAK